MPTVGGGGLHGQPHRRRLRRLQERGAGVPGRDGCEQGQCMTVMCWGHSSLVRTLTCNSRIGNDVEFFQVEKEVDPLKLN